MVGFEEVNDPSNLLDSGVDSSSDFESFSSDFFELGEELFGTLLDFAPLMSCQKPLIHLMA